jgi:geranylgeranyl diphosphate synthase type II
MAILAGDAMLAMAFDVIARHAPPATAIAMTRDLAAATGPQGMIGGQVLDMESENQPIALEQLQQIHRRKTGALLTASCRLGALAAGANESQLHAITEFGQHLGLAFQIVDDLLDVTSTPQQLGKTTHKDQHRGKRTYPALIGVDASRAEAERQLAAARSALQSLGERGSTLVELASFVLSRSS